MRVSIIGAGYVGLVTGACLADKGHQVVLVDTDVAKIDRINRGVSPIHEQGLDELLERHIGGDLRATTDLYSSVVDTDLTLIAVGTPYNGREIDLRYIREAVRQIGEVLKDKSTYHLVVVKSTVVPGTLDEVVLPILEGISGKKAGLDFGVGVNPEFLTEGVAVRDFMYPDRIVVGGIDEQSLQILENLYGGFEGVDILRTNNKTAEMIKYASNALLATMVSFSNEIGNLCAALGSVDVVDVMRGVHMSNYLSPLLPTGDRSEAPITSFLAAGCGFGGSCLPKDVKALIAHGEKAGVAMRVLEAVIQVNERQYEQIFSLLKRHFLDLRGIRVAVLGLAFKPDTDDMRESPAVPIIEALLAQQAQVKAYDPAASSEARRRFGDEITLCDDLHQATADVEAIVLVTRWDEFKELPELLSNLSLQPVVIDGRRMLDKASISKYEGIGL